MRSLRDFPFGSRTTPRAGVRARAFATAATSRREVRGCRTTRAGAAEARESKRHVVEDVRLERLGIVGRQHGIEQQPFDVRRVGERIRERQLRAVRGAPERDLVDPERHADGLRVVGVIVGAVEVARRADRGRAAGGERILADERRRLLQGLADEEARLAGATVVERDDPVAREERVIEVGTVLVAEIEHRGRPLTRAAGDEHHDAALGALGGKRLDVERDRPRHATRAVERHDDVGARDAGLGVTRGRGSSGAIGSGRSRAEERRSRRGETFRLAARSGATAPGEVTRRRQRYRRPRKGRRPRERRPRWPAAVPRRDPCVSCARLLLFWSGNPVKREGRRRR